MLSYLQPNELNTAVLLIAFNRPETTQRVFDVIRKVKPSRLYIALDAPRPGVINDIKNCLEVEDLTNQIDWKCELKKLVRNENMGSGKGPSTAITWFFTHETEGIILEDDCVPSLTFFTYCATLLSKYRDDNRIVAIGGNNFSAKDVDENRYSYCFSSMTHVWGWATWRRAWQNFDFNMSLYPEIEKKKYLQDSFAGIYERDFFQYIFSKMYKGDAITSSKKIWDYQWQFACKIHSGLVIVPNCNLVKNIGFGANASNTKNLLNAGHNLKLEEIEFPLKHPSFVMRDFAKEREVFRMINTSFSSRAKSQIKNLFTENLKKSVKYYSHTILNYQLDQKQSV